jgi:hypothetical protein
VAVTGETLQSTSEIVCACADSGASIDAPKLLSFLSTAPSNTTSSKDASIEGEKNWVEKSGSGSLCSRKLIPHHAIPPS